MKKYNNKSNCFGPIMKEYRLKNKIGVTELCRKLELLGVYINRKDIYSMENCTMIIKDFELVAIAYVLNIPLDNLVIDLMIN